MIRRLGVAALLLPLIEIALFVEIGRHLGVWVIFAAVAGSAVLGVWVLRRQGRNAVWHLQAAFARGDPLPHATFDALGRVIAGLLLIFPGVFSDLLAVILLVRPLRRALGRRLFGSRRRPPPGGGRQGQVIEGEYSNEDDRHRH